MQCVVLVHNNEYGNRLIAFPRDEYGAPSGADVVLTTIGCWGGLHLTGVGLAVV
jgi:hypothetical protein